MQLYHPRTSVKSFRGVFFGFCERNRMTDLSALHEATPQRIINVYKRSVFIIFFFFFFSGVSDLVLFLLVLIKMLSWDMARLGVRFLEPYWARILITLAS